MEKSESLFSKHKIAIISVFIIIFYLMIKSLFWPLQKNISVLIQQNQANILNLNTEPTISRETSFEFDKLNFRQDNELFHDNTGYLGFKNDFFMQISTQMLISKQAIYSFRISSDDGFRLLINNVPVCEYLHARAFSETICSYPLNTGEHLLELQYYQGYGDLGLTMSYHTEGGDELIVGENSANITFFQKTDTVPFTAGVATRSAIEELTRQAVAGDVNAQFILATKYLNGDGIAKKQQLAFKWFKMAAKNGDIDAQLHIGDMYYQGIGTKQDTKKAWYWLNLAANNFSTDAQLYIAQLYYDGNGIEQNYATAFFWLKKAAGTENEDTQHPFFVSKKSGNVDAQLLLAKMYQLGQGVEPNQQLAKKWLLMAAEQGSLEE